MLDVAHPSRRWRGNDDLSSVLIDDALQLVPHIEERCDSEGRVHLAELVRALLALRILHG